MSTKERLDVALVARGLAETRAKAQASIMSGIVYVNRQKGGWHHAADYLADIGASTGGFTDSKRREKGLGDGGVSHRALTNCITSIGASTGR